MENPMLEKLKNPKYAFFFFLRMIGASISSASSIGSFSEGELINGLLWITLCVQFLFDGETFSQSFKLNRNFFVGIILLLLIVVNLREITDLINWKS